MATCAPCRRDEMDISIPQAVAGLVESIKQQTDLVTAMSAAALGLVLVTWTRVIGLQKDLDLSGFRFPKLLIVPLIGFLVSICCGYLIYASITGFYAEIAAGVSAQGQKISDAGSHFISDYWHLQGIGQIQLSVAMAAVVVFAIWFIFNIYSWEKRR
jgi:hypothetical protein